MYRSAKFANGCNLITELRRRIIIILSKTETETFLWLLTVMANHCHLYRVLTTMSLLVPIVFAATPLILHADPEFAMFSTVSGNNGTTDFTEYHTFANVPSKIPIYV